MKKTRILIALALSAAILTPCSAQTAATNESSQAASETIADQTSAASAVASAAGQEETTAGTTDIDAINAAVAALEAVEPEVLGKVNSLGTYTGLAVSTAKHVEISDEEVEAYIQDSILPDYTKTVTDAIKAGDTANIDYEGKENGVAFEGGTAQGYDLEIGSGSFIDGFEDGLIGKKAGETVDLVLTFPEDYGNADLAGHKVTFTVKINSVKRQRELDDALVKELAAEYGESFGTVDQFKKYAKEKLQKSNDLTEKQELYYEAVKKALENADITATDEAIDYTVKSYVKNYAEAISASYGIDFGTMMSYYGASLEEFMDSYKEYAIDSVKQRILLQEVAKKENITVNAEDIKAFAESYGYDVETLKATVGEKLMNELVLEDKANAFLVEKAVVTYEEETEADGNG